VFRHESETRWTVYNDVNMNFFAQVDTSDAPADRQGRFEQSCKTRH
jgi:hypothetical protein